MSDNPKVMVEYYREEKKQKILAMEPGKELNRIIGKELFGMKFVKLPAGYMCYQNGKWTFAKPYSEDISAAWEVVERLVSLDNHIDVYTSKNGKWGMEVSKGDEVYVREFAATTPEAICKAGLIAMMEGGERE